MTRLGASDWKGTPKSPPQPSASLFPPAPSRSLPRGCRKLALLGLFGKQVIVSLLGYFFFFFFSVSTPFLTHILPIFGY